MSEAPRFFVGPEDAEINPGSCRHFFHHADEEEEEEDESVSVFLWEDRPSAGLLLITDNVDWCSELQTFLRTNLWELFSFKEKGAFYFMSKLLESIVNPVLT